MYNMLLQNVLVDIESVKYYFETLLPEVEKARKEASKYNILSAFTIYYLNIDKENQVDENLRNEIDAAIKKNLDIETNLNDDGEVTGISIKVKKGSTLNSGSFETNLSRADLGYKKATKLSSIHYSNALIMFVVKFEEFLSNLYRCILSTYSDQYLADKTIKYCDLCTATTVESARELLITLEVESFMRKSFSDWCKFFEERKINLSLVNGYLDKLKEILLRRNLIVHNKGLVNSGYLRFLPDSSKDGIKEGTRIEISEDYLKGTYTTIEIVVFALVISITKLIHEPNERRKHLEKVFYSAFSLLEQEEWEQCSIIFQMLLCSEYIDNNYKEMSRVNLWIARKNLNLDDSWKKEVALYDVSALAPKYSLAKAILLEHNQEALQIIQLLYPNEINAQSLKEWPLFKQFRMTSEYESFRRLHWKEFDVQVKDKEESQEEEGPLDLIDLTLPTI